VGSWLQRQQNLVWTKGWEKIHQRIPEISRKEPSKTGISSIFGHAGTLTFDLLTPKPNQFISVPRRISDKSLAKIVNAYRRYRGNISDGRTDRHAHSEIRHKNIMPTAPTISGRGIKYRIIKGTNNDKILTFNGKYSTDRCNKIRTY